MNLCSAKTKISLLFQRVHFNNFPTTKPGGRYFAQLPVMKDWAKLITIYLSNTVEIIAAVVIGIAILKFLYRYFRPFSLSNSSTANEKLRIEFGSSVALALELLLGADVLATAVAPTWDEIGKLAAIAALRTALNFFLEQELRSSGLKPSPKDIND